MRCCSCCGARLFALGESVWWTLVLARCQWISLPVRWYPPTLAVHNPAPPPTPSLWCSAASPRSSSSHTRHPLHRTPIKSSGDITVSVQHQMTNIQVQVWTWKLYSASGLLEIWDHINTTIKVPFDLKIGVPKCCHWKSTLKTQEINIQFCNA